MCAKGGITLNGSLENGSLESCAHTHAHTLACTNQGKGTPSLLPSPLSLLQEEAVDDLNNRRGERKEGRKGLWGIMRTATVAPTEEEGCFVIFWKRSTHFLSPFAAERIKV